MAKATQAKKTEPVLPHVISYRDFIDPELKGDDWILETVQDHYTFGGAESLTHGKDVEEIKKHAAGDQSTEKYKAMFKSNKKDKRKPKVKADKDGKVTEVSGVADYGDITGIDWEPLGILNSPLNAAISIIEKSPIYITCTAIDGAALEKKKKDKDFLQNRKYLAEALGDVGAKLKINSIEVPNTRYNSDTIDISKFNLDPSSEDELNLYLDIFYKLKPESAFESALLALEYLNDLKACRDLEIRDQFYYGVSSSRKFFSDVTGLPMAEYWEPEKVFAPKSRLKDYTDVPFIYCMKNYNAEQMVNTFGSATITEEKVTELHDQYWASKGLATRWVSSEDTDRRHGLPVVYMEFKTFNILKIHKRKTALGRNITEPVPFNYEMKDRSGKKKNPSRDEYVQSKYPQQTYYAYWIPGTDTILKGGVVEGSFRDRGKESISKFTINIERSQKKGAVELCIPAVNDAQRAYFKLQHAIIMAKPKGVFFDAKYIRNAVEMLNDANFTFERLLQAFADNNIMMGDSEDFDGNQAGNFPPFREIPGGLSTEIDGYLKIIANSNLAIQKLTGINDTLTGQTQNPDALVGIEKMRLQSSINSIYYVNVAIKRQLEKTFKAWGSMIQYIAKHPNSESYKSLEYLIGSVKMSLMGSLGDIPLHHFGIMVEDAPTEEQQQELRQILLEMMKVDRIDLADYFTVRRVLNYKDAQSLLIIREKKRRAEKQQERRENNAAMVQSAQIKEAGKLQSVKMTVDGNLQEQAMENQLKEKLAQFNAQHEEAMQQLEFQIKSVLQDRRGAGQVQKLVTSHNLNQQSAVA